VAAGPDLERFRLVLQSERDRLLHAAQAVHHEGSLIEETGETMSDTGLAAVIQFVWRGRENVAAMRAHDGTLVLHTLFFADEVRDSKEIGTPKAEVAPYTTPSR